MKQLFDTESHRLKDIFMLNNHVYRSAAFVVDYFHTQSDLLTENDDGINTSNWLISNGIIVRKRKPP